MAETCRNEYVISVEGKVRERPEGTVNLELDTGEVEVVGSSLKILNPSLPIPFQLDEHASVGEETRLKYRFLDLRREEMQKNIRLRSKTSKCVRDYLETNEFIEIETPLLTKATPEGARDYLVPSRTFPGSFFALPQSPQLFKQTLMASGFQRYYQFARCFRDEDLRSDRQPEFTQIDLECSFVTSQNIKDLVTDLLKKVFFEVLNIKLGKFPTLTYEDAIAKFGTDKPDLRNPLVLEDVSEIMHALADVGLTSREACGNTVRNVMCSPLSGVCDKEEFDATPYALAVAKFLLRNPLNQSLPRKFKFNFTCCEKQGMIRIVDVGLLPQIKDVDGKKQKGFKIFLGGGLGNRSFVGHQLEDFTPIEDLLYTSIAVLRIFDRMGDRKNMARNRMR